MYKMLKIFFIRFSFGIKFNDVKLDKFSAVTAVEMQKTSSDKANFGKK